MNKAYVLINIEAGKALNVLNAVKNLDGVKQVHLTMGLHDLVAYLEADDLFKLKDVITDGIHKVDGVTRTVTMPVVNS